MLGYELSSQAKYAVFFHDTIFLLYNNTFFVYKCMYNFRSCKQILISIHSKFQMYNSAYKLQLNNSAYLVLLYQILFEVDMSVRGNKDVSNSLHLFVTLDLDIKEDQVHKTNKNKLRRDLDQFKDNPESISLGLGIFMKNNYTMTINKLYEDL